MNSVFYASLIEEQFRDRLEELMFFNPQQRKMSVDIIRSLQKYGEPRIVVEGGYLVVRVGAFPDVQTLFALDDSGEGVELIGMMIYIRTSIEDLYVLQIAVEDKWSLTGEYADQNLVMKMMARLLDIARRIRGIENIRLSYNGKDMCIPVRRDLGGA